MHYKTVFCVLMAAAIVHRQQPCCSGLVSLTQTLCLSGYQRVEHRVPPEQYACNLACSSALYRSYGVTNCNQAFPVSSGCVAQVGTLQMHGTGTALGDPIEVNAALAALLPAPKGRAAVAGVRCILQHRQLHFVLLCLMPDRSHMDSAIAIRVVGSVL
jgi:Beta-ketoacyl synthase, C-terminal domain